MNAGDTDSMGRISASQLKGWVFGPTAAERIAVALHGQERSPQNLGKKKKFRLWLPPVAVFQNQM